MVNEKPRLKYWLSANNADGAYLKHVRNIFELIGYERWDGKSGTWDVMWSYEYPFSSKLSPSALKPHQLVNHFPGSGYLTSKVFLATSKFKYIPTAFNLPQEKNKFLEYANAHQDKLWVQKSNQHRGITIKSIKDLDLDASDSFVQEFVKDPFLIDGKKFDIGLYTIITSIDPLRVYVFDGDWLIRFCPQSYLPLDVHNPNKYVVGDDYTPVWQMPSLKDTFTKLKFSFKDTLLSYLRKQGHDEEKFRKELYEAVADMTLEKRSDMLRSLSRYPYGSDSFFEMVRFDFVVDSQLHIYLMEVNMSPNLSSAHFEDNAILYEQVVFNTLSLSGVVSAAKRRNTIDRFHATDRDIQVYDDICQDCSDCSADRCQLCNPCLSKSTKEMLKYAYMEQLNRMRSVKIFPKVLNPQKDVMDIAGLSEKDKLLHLWYRGMCKKDSMWCG
ncbi:unnamed protein product [Clavelina lepadiformis]|uniref:Uncharacterized protein n=1 Tax=Clavelina lepadiformis TaxID=159417 RepID=A0ABP0F196_CLALP